MTDFKRPDFKKARFRSDYKAEIIRDALTVSDTQKELCRGLFYHVITYGCQANVRDSEIIAGILEQMGYSFTDLLEQADLIILNTCAIRENAEKRVLGELGFLQNYKRLKPSIILGLCGCMAQEEAVVDKIISSYPFVQLLFGTHNIFEMPQMIENILVNERRSINVYSRQGNIYESLPSRRLLKHKASVSIMEGCDKFCTYCIVPYTRGQQRSRLLEDILNEVLELKNDGYREVLLLGQNVNAYGKDLKDRLDFASLLRRVAETNIERVRFMTSHPWDFTDEMIRSMAEHPNIMPFLHLPLQSGSNEVLKLMGRKYTREQYRELFDKLKNQVKDLAVSTDIIVGFPNESEAQFLQTLEMVEHCRYDNAYSFIFSARPGTPAARMDDSIPQEVKKERLQRLNARLAFHSKENNKKWENETVEVLVDGPSKNRTAIYSGYTPQQKLVNFEPKDCRIGDIIEVKITQAMKNSLNGVQL